jgi:hypothetical protein
MHRVIIAFVPAVALLGGSGVQLHQQRNRARTVIDPSSAPRRWGVPRRHGVPARTICAESSRCNTQTATIS